MDAYGIDLRVRVIEDCESGMGTLAVARKYRVSDRWVRKLKRQRRESGSVAPKKPKVHRESKLDPYLDDLRRMIEQKPDATLNELRAQLPIQASLSCVWRMVRKLQLTFKKSPARQRAAAVRRTRTPHLVASQRVGDESQLAGVH